MFAIVAGEGHTRRTNDLVQLAGFGQFCNRPQARLAGAQHDQTELSRSRSDLVTSDLDDSRFSVSQ